MDQRNDNDSYLFKLYSHVELAKTILMFKGILTQDILVVLAEMLKNNLSNDSKRKTTKKMFSIFVELAQNIHRYSEEKYEVDGKLIGSGIVLVNEYAESYHIISGNVVTKEKEKWITEQFTYLNSLSPDELKVMRKEKMKANRDAGQRGAGLGLIDIVRKSSGPLEVKVKPIDDEHSFVSFFILLEKECA